MENTLLKFKENEGLGGVMPRGLCTVLHAVVLAAGAFAQSTEVANVRFEQKGGLIVIKYDLYGKTGGKYTVSAALSDDKGKSFEMMAVSLSGDVGRDVTPGSNKTITWRMLMDYPMGLEGDDFVFAVDAKLQKGSSKWPYMVGAAVVGGAAYVFTRPKKGSVTIKVPADL
jgi:hypothetical protein